jgi:glycosyltransferase 2 family protein
LKRLLSISLRLVISGVVLFLLFREHDLISEIAPRFRSLLVNWPWAVGGIAFAFVSLLLTAVRWHILLRGFAPTLAFGLVLRAEIVSAFFNISSLGVVGGDAYKIMSLSRRLPGQTMPVSVSLVLDHLAGLVAVALLFAACIAAKAADWPDFGPDARMLVSGYGMYIGVAVAGLALSWLSFKPSLLEWGRRTFPRTFGHPKFASTLARMTQVHDVFHTLWQRALSATFVALFLHVALLYEFLLRPARGRRRGTRAGCAHGHAHRRCGGGATGLGLGSRRA